MSYFFFFDLSNYMASFPPSSVNSMTKWLHIWLYK